MTNYNLEEFKAWLEVDESRKAGLDWTGVFNSMSDNGIEKWLTFPGDHLKSYRQIALKWKAQVDQRERERERERERAKPKWGGKHV